MEYYSAFQILTWPPIRRKGVSAWFFEDAANLSFGLDLWNWDKHPKGSFLHYLAFLGGPAQSRLLEKEHQVLGANGYFSFLLMGPSDQHINSHREYPLKMLNKWIHLHDLITGYRKANSQLPSHEGNGFLQVSRGILLQTVKESQTSQTEWVLGWSEPCDVSQQPQSILISQGGSPLPFLGQQIEVRACTPPRGPGATSGHLNHKMQGGKDKENVIKHA